MSTKVSIKWQEQTTQLPGFHLYEEAFDGYMDDPPVYMRLDGVEAEMSAMDGRVSVTVTLPRALARELGVLPIEEQL